MIYGLFLALQLIRFCLVIASERFVVEDGAIAGFWNIYAEGKHFRSIVDEQKRVVDSSGLMDKLHVLYYTTMGEHGQLLQLNGQKMQHLQDFGRNGTESQTLNEVYKFCKTHPSSKVLYFHNKGSLNFNILNTNFRRALDCFVLNPQCIEALNYGYDTCGWRLSPLPHMHYSGNYWWATCKHINKLISPVVHTYNETFLQLTSKLYVNHKKTVELPSQAQPFPDQPYLGLGRYFAETWVSSPPMFRPADCMNASMNNRYMWGKYPLPWRLVNKRCPNYKADFMISTSLYETTDGVAFPVNAADTKSSSAQYLTYGLPCAKAGFIAQPKVVKKRFALSPANFTPELLDRSLIWYGQPPVLHLGWLNLYS